MRTAAMLIIIALSLAMGCARPYSGKDLPYEDETEKEDYAVYSQSIEYVYQRNLLSHNKRELKSIVVISQTDELDEYWKDKLVSDLENEGIQDEVIEAWMKENESAILLQRKFDFEYKYYMVTRDELNEYKSDNFFGEFYKRYPDSNGLISVSRIGYDKTRNTALIHVIHSFGTLGARYYFIMLQKSAEGWDIVRRISTE
jgi:hypothetical protein